MAPCQAQGRTDLIGPPTDVYGLGAILYELLLRRPPIRGTNDADTLRRVVNEEPTRLRTVRRDLPRDLEAICLKCLEKEPSRRYGRAGHLALDLRRFLKGEPTEARPIGMIGHLWKWSRRRPAAAALVGVTLLAATVIVVMLLVYSARVKNALEVTEKHRRDALSLVRDLRQEAYVSDMGRALQAWQQGDVENAIALLNRYQPQPGELDLRGFEWHYLQHRFADQGRVLSGHQDAVYQAAISFDGKLLATASADQTIKIWDTDGWRERVVLRGHNSEVNAVSFSPDARWLASGSDDKTVRIWNLSTMKEERIAATLGDEVIGVAFSPTGKILAVAPRKGQIHLIDTTSWMDRASLDFRGEFESLAFSPDGNELAAGGLIDTIKRWDISQFPIVKSLDDVEDSVNCGSLQFSPDGRKLFAGNIDGQLLRIQRAGTQIEHSGRQTIRLTQRSLDALAISPDSWTIAAAGVQGVVRLVNASDFQEYQQFIGHRDVVWGLVWLLDCHELVSCSSDCTARVWDTEKVQGHQVVWDSGSPMLLSTVSFGFGRDLWLNSSNEVWNIDCGCCNVTRRFRSDDVNLITNVRYALSVENERAIIFRSNFTQQVWDFRSRRAIFTVPTMASLLQKHYQESGGVRICQAGISPDGQRVVVPNLEGEVAIWDVDSNRKLLLLGKRYEQRVLSAEFSPDGHLVIVKLKGQTDLFDVTTGSSLLTCPDTPLIFAPDGRFFIQTVVGRIDTFRLTDLNREHPIIRNFEQPEIGERLLAISPDGKTLVTTNIEHDLWFWNVATGQMMFRLKGPRYDVKAATFSPDGKILATLGEGERYEVLLWRADDPTAMSEPK